MRTAASTVTRLAYLLHVQLDFPVVSIWCKCEVDWSIVLTFVSIDLDLDSIGWTNDAECLSSVNQSVEQSCNAVTFSDFWNCHVSESTRHSRCFMRANIPHRSSLIQVIKQLSPNHLEHVVIAYITQKGERDCGPCYYKTHIIFLHLLMTFTVITKMRWLKKKRVVVEGEANWFDDLES